MAWSFDALDGQRRQLAEDAEQLVTCLRAWQRQLSVLDQHPRDREVRLAKLRLELQLIAEMVVSMTTNCAHCLERGWLLMDPARWDPAVGPSGRSLDNADVQQLGSALHVMKRLVQLHAKLLALQRETWALVQRLEVIEGYQHRAEEIMAQLLARLRQR